MSQYKVDEKGTIKRKQDKANPVDKSIHLFKGFNKVLRRVSLALYQPLAVTESIY